MSLDMYFHRQHYVSDLNPEGVRTIDQLDLITGPPTQSNITFQSRRIFVPIGSLHGEWDIHEWFMTNVVHNDDWCGYSPFQLSDIDRLIKDKVKMNHPKSVNAVWAALRAEGDHEFYYDASW